MYNPSGQIFLFSEREVMKSVLAVFIFLFLATGCQNDGELDSKSLGKVVSKGEGGKSSSKASAFKPFYVYENKGSRENHFVPSGFMPDGDCVTFSDRWQEDCQDDKTCIKVEYDVECSADGQKWAGIYWLNPANNWGSRKGGFDLSGAKQLTFWAKGEEGGEQIQEVTIGGVEGMYPDSDKVIFGPIILSNKWKKYTVDLRGKDLTYISGGFSWSTEEAVNPVDCHFYLDNIRYE
ncbi:MAG: hypothetical protein ACI9F2_000368 [Lysobacterales bacterium]